MRPTLAQLSSEYKQFFERTESGKYFLHVFTEEVDRWRRLAEESPDHARDYTQHSKAYRGVLEHIDSVVKGVKPKQD